MPSGLAEPSESARGLPGRHTAAEAPVDASAKGSGDQPEEERHSTVSALVEIPLRRAGVFRRVL